VKDSDEKEFIIGTENGMLYRIQVECPAKKVYPVSSYVICPNMKMNTLRNLEKVLREKNEENLVRVDDTTAKKAKKAIDRMFELME
jgi:quinolinate synthase